MLGGGTQKSLRKALGAIKDSTTVNFKFFAFEVCPVLLVRVEEEPNGFCIKLLSCKLEGSPIVVAQNEEIDASMVNRVSCDRKQSDSSVAELTSDTVIEVSIEIPFAFRPIPVQAIESTGTQVLEQILRIMLPCFMAQVLLGITLLELDMLDTFEDVEYNRCTVEVSLMVCMADIILKFFVWIIGALILPFQTGRYKMETISRKVCHP